MTLTVAQLEDALFCARSYRGECFTAPGAAFADGIICALESEIALRGRIERLRLSCKTCSHLLHEADSHLADCLSRKPLPEGER